MLTRKSYLEIATTTTTTTTTTTSGPTTFLVVNSYHSGNKPVLIDVHGRTDYGFDFDMPSTVHGGCSLMHKNKQYYYGGWSGDAKKQILELKFCTLKQIGSLDWKMEECACTAVSAVKFFLCFDKSSSKNYKRCYFTTDPMVRSYTEAQESNFNHNACQISSSSGKSKKVIKPNSFS